MNTIVIIVAAVSGVYRIYRREQPSNQSGGTPMVFLSIVLPSTHPFISDTNIAIIK
jgi:hypothetical protein